MAKMNSWSSHYSCLHKNHFILWFGAQETFLIIINVEKQCCAAYTVFFVETEMLFSGFYDE